MGEMNNKARAAMFLDGPLRIFRVASERSLINPSTVGRNFSYDLPAASN
jgi:hypothetical protein